MTRETWAIVKSRRYFNVNLYRRSILVLIFILMLTIIVELVMFYIYLNQPKRDYYATSGITAPVKLNPLLAPNASSTALLDPDSPTDGVEKLIPQ